ncbi:hypothetical protein ACFL6T_02025 [Candidatus Zixiibacteriota bacterium]
MEFPGMFGFGIFAMIMMFVAFGALITVVPFWKICERVGLPGPLSLLMLVPLANIILPFYIAFTKWPIEENTSGHQQ